MLILDKHILRGFRGHSISTVLTLSKTLRVIGSFRVTTQAAAMPSNFRCSETFLAFHSDFLFFHFSAFCSQDIPRWFTCDCIEWVLDYSPDFLNSFFKSGNVPLSVCDITWYTRDRRFCPLSSLSSLHAVRRQTNCKHCSVTWPTLNPDWPVPLNLALAATVLVCDVMCLFLKLCGFQLVLGRLQIESNSGGSCGTSQFDLERWNVCKQSRLSGSFCRSCLCRTSVMNRANPELTDNTG